MSYCNVFNLQYYSAVMCENLYIDIVPLVKKNFI